MLYFILNNIPKRLCLQKNWNPLPISFLLLLLFLSNFSLSQSKDIRFRLYDFNDGLTHRNVFKIQQDIAGFIWIATINGLNKFDGHEFIHFTTDDVMNHIPNNFITDMMIDSDNQIWIGSGHDLIKMDAVNCDYEIIEQEISNRNTGTDFHFYNLFKDEQNNLWTATFQEQTGNIQIRKKAPDQPLKHWQDLPNSYLQRSFSETSEGLWLGASKNELWKSDRNSSFSIFHAFPSDSITGQVPRILQTQTTTDSTLWILLSDGKVMSKQIGDLNFEKHPISNSIPPQDSVVSFLVEESGDIWIGGSSRLWYYDAYEKRTYDYQKYLNEIFEHTTSLRQIFADNTGGLWVATDFGVLSIHRFQKLFVNYLSEGHEFCRDGTCSTRGITEDENGNIYISYYHSIHILDPKTGNTQPLFGRNRYFQFPFSIMYHNQALWTGEGLRIDLKTLKIDTIIPQNEGAEGVNMMDSDGNIWFGCEKNLCIYDPTIENLTDYKDITGTLDTVNFNSITYLHESKNPDIVWIGTKENGIYKISKREGVLAHYYDKENSPSKLSSPRVLALTEDNNQNLWIATGNGINKLDIPSETVQVFTTEDGLPNNFINGILLEGDSVLWVSTDRGLSRLDIFSDTFTNFMESDGLSRNEFNRISFFQASDGRMYFGGLNGINAFYPGEQFSQKAKDKQEAKLLLTAFTKFDGILDSLVSIPRDLENDQLIRLSWRDKFMTFRFTLADYANPRGHSYSYKLEGYDEDWSTPSNVNFARYNGVPAGKYTFKVKARIDNGEWGKNELIVPIKIDQAFYKSIWFFVLCGLFTLSLFYGILRYRLYLDAERRKQLERMVTTRTAQLKAEKQKSDELLLNILPAELAEELKEFGIAKARRHEHVTVFFSDFKDFSKIAENMEPEKLVSEVDFLFRAFDEIIDQNGLEKIKTIGDAYMCVGGIANESEDEPLKVVKAALEIQAFIKAVEVERLAKNLPHFEARIGIHTGPVVAGIVGIKKFAYDIWGDTVNIAARMEQTSQTGRVNISESTYQLIKEYFECTYRGKITAKNKGEIDMYFVENLKPKYRNRV
ncbi:MAG: hypothetical protein NXI23_16155 [Bacteroidetes bacterium]|nr:hypothetical protein [Bacteroidota bacterium]